MINIKQIKKQLIGMPALVPLNGVIKIKDVRQLSNGKILVYNQHNWCCDLNVIRDTNKQKFIFEKEEKIEDKGV